MPQNFNDKTETELADVFRITEYNVPENTPFYVAVGFGVGNISLGTICYDNRVSLPWIVDYNNGHHGWRDSALRFDSKENAIEFVLGKIGLKIEGVKRESHE